MKTEIARSNPTSPRKKNKGSTKPKKSKTKDLSSNVVKIIMSNRFTMSSMLILSIFVDAKGESLYDGEVRIRFKNKFKIDVENKTSALLKTFSDRGLLKIDEVKNANPEFQGRGNYRKYFFATNEAEELIEYLYNLSSEK